MPTCSQKDAKCGHPLVSALASSAPTLLPVVCRALSLRPRVIPTTEAFYMVPHLNAPCRSPAEAGATSAGEWDEQARQASQEGTRPPPRGAAKPGPAATQPPAICQKLRGGGVGGPLGEGGSTPHPLLYGYAIGPHHTRLSAPRGGGRRYPAQHCQTYPKRTLKGAVVQTLLVTIVPNFRMCTAPLFTESAAS